MSKFETESIEYVISELETLENGWCEVYVDANDKATLKKIGYVIRVLKAYEQIKEEDEILRKKLQSIAAQIEDIINEN